MPRKCDDRRTAVLPEEAHAESIAGVGKAHLGVLGVTFGSLVSLFAFISRLLALGQLLLLRSGGLLELQH